MAKVLGVGGVFFKTKDPKALGAWYQKWLELPIDPNWNGAVFLPTAMPPGGGTVWAPFEETTTYFEPSSQTFMFNLVVDDLDLVDLVVTFGLVVVALFVELFVGALATRLLTQLPFFTCWFLPQTRGQTRLFRISEWRDSFFG